MTWKRKSRAFGGPAYNPFLQSRDTQNIINFPIGLQEDPLTFISLGDAVSLVVATVEKKMRERGEWPP